MIDEKDIAKIEDFLGRVQFGYDTGQLSQRYYKDVKALLRDRGEMADRLRHLEAALELERMFVNDVNALVCQTGAAEADTGRQWMLDEIKRLVEADKK